MYKYTKKLIGSNDDNGIYISVPFVGKSSFLRLNLACAFFIYKFFFFHQITFLDVLHMLLDIILLQNV